ncbi:MAG: phosphatidate cytidylyltransferase [Clostridia bacterium]|nr:phosphatidate cytidylyltransferase [Clostridia bacterium]
MDNLKRVLSALILFPIVAIVLIFGNQYFVDGVIAVIAIMSLYEFYKAFRTGNKANPINWVGYIIATVAIVPMHMIPSQWILKVIGAIIPISILILFATVIFTNLKTNIKDIAITILGICYIVLFMMFLPIIRENLTNGKILIWFVFFAAWGTDVFAFWIGRKFGKHKFTQISPNKTIEGCIGGTIGAIAVVVIYAIICNQVWNLQFNYFYITMMGLVLSILSQFGDLAASAIKRYTGIKDFSELIPGHGGMLDRIDSILFIAPFAYFLLMLI